MYGEGPVRALFSRGRRFSVGLKPEKNGITALFASTGMRIDNALASQAVIQLRNAYCIPRKCLYCNAGHKMLASK